jgi:hypothetical protein
LLAIEPKPQTPTRLRRRRKAFPVTDTGTELKRMVRASPLATTMRSPAALRVASVGQI